MVDSPVSDDEEDFEQRRDKFRSERDEMLSVSSGNVQNPTPTSTDPVTSNPPASVAPPIAKNTTSQTPTPTANPTAATISPAAASSNVASHKRLASQRDERPKSPEYKRSGGDRGILRFTLKLLELD